MKKALFVTEKPSVAQEFAKVLNIKGSRRDGYIESEKAVITWCVGHLVTMSYPEAYDASLKKWKLEDLPFLPKKYRYEVIKSAKKQFETIKAQMKREDISRIYVCTDSGREGEYIYRLVDEMVGVDGKDKKRVWIDSQTEEEIKKGIQNAKPLSEYDRLSDSAYLRAKEDYLIGINFSRLLTLSYSRALSKKLNKDYVVIAVGRVMTCVLGMIVQREREIRDFVKTPYYKIISKFNFEGSLDYDGEWKAIEGSDYYLSKLLFKDIGFKDRMNAQKFIEDLKVDNPDLEGEIQEVSKKKEKKNAPLLYNLAEIQNECAKRFKLSPDQTLSSIQDMYEKKMLTYPRTDARVLSKAVAKEIHKNIRGLTNIAKACNLGDKDGELAGIAGKILDQKMFTGLEKTKYVNDKAITDHYAIVPTGQGLSAYNKLSDTDKQIYILVVRRFLAIFYPAAIFSKLAITTKIKEESFFTSAKVCVDEGYMEVFKEKQKNQNGPKQDIETLKKLKKGQKVKISELIIKDGETSPPKRYNSGAMILAMENAGKLIEDEELREQIKGSGIGTSATRAEILKKLEKIKYIKLNKKTQILTPSELGEMIYDVVSRSVASLLNPALTASWEKGLTMVSNGEIKPDEYMEKLEGYVMRNTQNVFKLNRYNPSDAKSDQAFEKRKRETLGECPLCKDGKIKENRKAYFCTNWQKDCKFTIWKDSMKSYGFDVTPEIMKELLDKGEIESFQVEAGKPKEKKLARLKLAKDGIVNIQVML